MLKKFANTAVKKYEDKKGNIFLVLYATKDIAENTRVEAIFSRFELINFLN